jgi:osmoprotectant transport system permease protein
MAAIAVVLGFAISFGLALATRRWRGLYAPILGVTGTLYAIPSLALFALVVPFTGLSLLSAEIALVSYTILILVRNIVTGLDAVPADVLEAATGMGLTPRQRLWRVELPIALPIIVAGLRIATVTTIGLVTVTSLIGQGGLGYLIVTIGYNGLFPTAILVGALLSVLLAVAADLGLVLMQRAMTPWVRARGA